MIASHQNDHSRETRTKGSLSSFAESHTFDGFWDSLDGYVTNDVGGVELLQLNFLAALRVYRHTFETEACRAMTAHHGECGS